MSKIYVGDIGTIFDINADPNATGLSLSGYTLSVEFRNPTGSTTSRAAGLKPASTSVVRYTIVSGDLNIAGLWKVQIKATLGANTWLGETAEFIVYAAFS